MWEFGDTFAHICPFPSMLCPLTTSPMSTYCTGPVCVLQVALSRQLTLKNAVELLEFSSMYGAEQLQDSCNQFICLNLAAVMENRWVLI